ncbi:MAG: hypothetical protein ACRC7I_14180 [Selenomonadaceae bacterium]|jgi:hypothetical protein
MEATTVNSFSPNTKKIISEFVSLTQQIKTLDEKTKAQILTQFLVQAGLSSDLVDKFSQLKKAQQEEILIDLVQSFSR